MDGQFLLNTFINWGFRGASVPEQTAIKEWEILCQAIRQGKQSFMLRKGGIAEPEGEFSVKDNGFWLFPTRFHGDQEKLNTRGRRLYAEHLKPSEEATETDPTKVSVDLFCELDQAIHLSRWWQVFQLARYQILSLETLEERFYYRRPGIYLLTFRAFLEPEMKVSVSPEMAGCRSWLQFPSETPQPTLEKEILTDEQFAHLVENLFLAIEREPA